VAWKTKQCKNKQQKRNTAGQLTLYSFITLKN
jgi:hypothetical protein